MVNFGLNAAAILGIFLAVAGAGLFFLRSIRPELARDYDIFFAAVGLLCGIILLFNGWRLDPILQFGQFLLTGTAIFFAFESVRMRGVATEQARRNTPTVDRDRPVSRTRVYTEAELDKIDPYDNNAYEGAKPNYSNPRLRGYDEPQPRTVRRSERKRAAPSADLRDEPRRRASRSRTESSDYVARAPEGDRYGYSDRDQDRDININSRPRRRPAASTPDANDQWDNNPRSAPRSRSRPRPSVEDPYSVPTPTPEPQPKASLTELGRSYEPEDDYSNNLGNSYSYDDSDDLGRSYEPDESIPGDYVVDYQPLEEPEVDDYDDYDDSEQGDYDDYDDSLANNSQEDYPEPPERRKPINFNNDYD
ncbi:MAG: Ycf66 family protein [Pleurocapsa sp.]